MISHPEKVLFPDAGITKGELATYYEQIAPGLLPHLARRPLTMERYPSGIAKKGFWQKDAPKGTPAWVERAAVPHRSGVVHYPLITDVRGVLWTANLNAITHHVWTTRAPDLFGPDICVFDLDPSENEKPEQLRSATLLLRDLLEELQLPSWVKTTGSKGFHVVVPLDGQTDTAQSAAFAHTVGALLVRRHPHIFTQQFLKADRAGRILVDTGRNEPGATFATAYTVRARAGAPVSAPCTWEEIERGEVSPASFHVRNMARRMDAVGELWSGLHARGASLREAMPHLERLAASVA
ncbi:MAG: non-homologous end-joining DNA ligase [Myxococcota bacterium]